MGAIRKLHSLLLGLSAILLFCVRNMSDGSVSSKGANPARIFDILFSEGGQRPTMGHVVGAYKIPIHVVGP